MCGKPLRDAKTNLGLKEWKSPPKQFQKALPTGREEKKQRYQFRYQGSIAGRVQAGWELLVLL